MDLHCVMRYQWKDNIHFTTILQNLIFLHLHLLPYNLESQSNFFGRVWIIAKRSWLFVGAEINRHSSLRIEYKPDNMARCYLGRVFQFHSSLSLSLGKTFP